jgi:hypothetical protein
MERLRLESFSKVNASWQAATLPQRCAPSPLNSSRSVELESCQFQVPFSLVLQPIVLWREAGDMKPLKRHGNCTSCIEQVKGWQTSPAARQHHHFTNDMKSLAKTSSVTAPAASDKPMRVLIVHQEECAFTCVWHLNRFFQEIPDTGDILWNSCSAEDLHEPMSYKEALEHAKKADLIVFCEPRSVALLREAKDWIERWVPEKVGQEAALGVLVPCSCGGSGTEAYLREVAARAGMAFLGMGHFSCNECV